MSDPLHRSIYESPDQSETSRLLAPKTDDAADRTVTRQDEDHLFDNVPSAKRQLGLFSAVLLIINRVIGTGIFATPSIILRSSGSVGVALLMWLVGASIATTGATVYVEFGTGLPRNGGEKNYLEFIYRRPKFLVTCIYAVYVVIIGSAAASSIVFGEYVIHSLSLIPTRYNTRFVALLCLTFCMVMHGTLPKWGLRLQNTLGVFKLFVLSAIALSGIFCLFGVPGFTVREGYDVPKNFEWKNFWEGSGTGSNAFVTGIYNVIWSFVGYQNANYALSEIKNPVRTLKRAVPLAMLALTGIYMLVNIAYFAAVSKADILGGERIVAVLFFRNLFGPTTERALGIVIAMSTLGSLLGSQFAQGRIIQELGREGVPPRASFFASSKPFNAPLAGLFAQYVISCAFVMGPPPGDAYLFMLSLMSYSSALINTSVSFGLLLLYTPAYRSLGWNPPFRAPKFIIILFFLSNVFLITVPLIPPVPESKAYDYLPYWLHPVVSLSASLIGIAYWYIWSVWRPRRGGYKLERDWVLQDDGVSRYAFHRVPNNN